MSVSGTNVGAFDRRSAVDENGRTRDELTFRILRLFFSPPFPPRHSKFCADEVAILLGAPGKKVASILEQLKLEDFLTEDPKQAGLYQYNYNCVHVERQAELEKVLL